MKRSVVIVSGVSVVLAGIIGFAIFREHMMNKFLHNMPEPVLTVKVEPIKATDWGRQISATGRLKAVNGVDVSAEVAGRVTDILFVAGQKVSEGMSLVKIDASVEKAQLQSAQAQVRLDKLTEIRYRRLSKTKAASQASLDEAVANLAMARANVEQYKQEIEKKDIKARFSGVIGIRQVDLGEYVQAGQEIATLQDLSAMDLDFTVSQKFLSELKVGAIVDVNVDSYPDKTFKGVLMAVDPKVDENSGLVSVQAHVPNEGGLLRPGMYAKVGVILPSMKSQLVVPQSAINFSLYGSFVYVVRKDDKGDQRVYQAIVDVLDRNANQAAVKGKLQAGDKVVTVGGVRLSNGSKIKMAETTVLEAKPAISLD